MLKRYLISPLMLLASIAASAEEAPVETSQPAAQENQGQSAYITDNLYTFLHAGAGKNYRILGSVDAGSPLSLVSGEVKNGFLEIVDDKGRSGWVEESAVSMQPGLRQQQESLRNEMAEAQQQLRELQLLLPEEQNKTKRLSAQLDELQKNVGILEKENKQLKEKQANQSGKEKRQLLIYGGSIAFLGLFLGILLTVILSRRKRYDGWA